MISEHRRRRPFHGFLAAFAAVAMVLGGPFVLNLVLFRQTGETLGFAEVAARQQETGALYGTALHGNRWAYRLSLLQARHADLVVLGSSRSEQFRQTMFAVRFTCLCTVMGSIGQAVPLLGEMLEKHRPEQVILIVDHWWFSDIPLDADDFWTHAGDTSITDQKLLRVFGWLTSGSLGFREYLNMLTGNRDLKSLSPEPKIGIQAIAIGRGYRPDGSALHADRVFGAPRYGTETDFAYVTDRLTRGDQIYPHDRSLSAQRLEELDRISDFAHSHNIVLTIMMAPMAPAIATAMRENGHFSYVDDIRNAVRERAATLGLRYHDYYDAEALGSGDCEFVDDRHGGEVVAARMLLAAVRTGGGNLAAVVDADQLEKDIAANRGRSLLLAETDRYAVPETDFLNRGCWKDRPSSLRLN